MFWIVNKKFAFLRITTWVGTFAYGTHYYGRIEFNGETEDVRKELSAREAETLNRDSEKFLDYEEGEFSSRFTDKVLLQDCAIKLYKEKFPEALGLIEGEPAIVEPQLILDGPKEFTEKVNVLAKELRKMDYGDYDEKRHEEICKEWEELEEMIE